MKRILLTVAVVMVTAACSQAGECQCQERQPVFPRLREVVRRVLGQPSGPMFQPLPQVIPQVMPAVKDAVFNRVSDAVRGLTLLPGSFGGCGPLGCPK